MLTELVYDAIQTVARCAGHEGLVDDADKIEKQLQGWLDENDPDKHNHHHQHQNHGELQAMMCKARCLLVEFAGSEFFDDDEHAHVLAVVQRGELCDMVSRAGQANQDGTNGTTGTTGTTGNN